MCGLAGTIDGTDIHKLMRLAARRGPHGFGISSLNEDVHKTVRYMSKHDTPPGPVLLGHCRMATDGCYWDRTRLQPLRGPHLAIAHNGVVPSLQGGEKSDTAMMLDMLEAERDACLSVRLRRVLKKLDLKRYALALTDWREVILARKGLPLFTDGHSWCSVPFGTARPISERLFTRLAIPEAQWEKADEL